MIQLAKEKIHFTSKQEQPDYRRTKILRKLASCSHPENQVIYKDVKWPKMFEQEQKHLFNYLPKELLKRVEHFGSTFVPGLAIKPIIDIMVEVSSLEETRQKIVPILEAQGYDYFFATI